jgi:hypothetical protein
MLSLRTDGPDAERRDREMNAYAIFAVNEHLEFLLTEAAERRMAGQLPKRTLKSRITAAIASVRAAVPTTVDTTSSILPRLDDYPYRS